MQFLRQPLLSLFKLGCLVNESFGELVSNQVGFLLDQLLVLDSECLLFVGECTEQVCMLTRPQSHLRDHLVKEDLACFELNLVMTVCAELLLYNFGQLTLLLCLVLILEGSGLEIIKRWILQTNACFSQQLFLQFDALVNLFECPMLSWFSPWHLIVASLDLV